MSEEKAFWVFVRDKLFWRKKKIQVLASSEEEAKEKAKRVVKKFG